MGQKQRSRRGYRDSGDFGSLPMHGGADEPWARPKQESRPKRDVPPLKAKTEAQRHYLAALRTKTLTIGLGPAGTGKTFCSAGLAAELLREGLIERFIATRPAVTAEEDLGFMPGGITEKFGPYFQPILDVLNERLGHSHVENLIRNEKIVALPIGFMRGLSFRDAFVLVDEAQNTTPGQMKMILTRVGEGTKICVEGDVAQTDLTGPNGLADVVARFRDNEHVAKIEFGEADIVRSGFVRDVLRAYRAPRCTPAPAHPFGGAAFGGVQLLANDVEVSDIPLPARYLPAHA